MSKKETNRQNAQLSTGPQTEEGKKRSSRNATSHGFTGQSLVISEAEREAYQAHVQEFRTGYSAVGHLEINIVQQLADLEWSIHQIFVQQANLMSMINAISIQLADDPLACANALTPHYRTLNTLGIYEQRRRRAVAAAEERLKTHRKAMQEFAAKELLEASQHYKYFKSKGEPFDPAEYGFVCSLEDIENFITGQALGLKDALGQKPLSAKDFIAETEANLLLLRQS